MEKIQKAIGINEALNERIKLEEEELFEFKKEYEVVKLQNTTIKFKGKILAYALNIVFYTLVILAFFNINYYFFEWILSAISRYKYNFYKDIIETMISSVVMISSLLPIMLSLEIIFSKKRIKDVFYINKAISILMGIYLLMSGFLLIFISLATSNIFYEYLPLANGSFSFIMKILFIVFMIFIALCFITKATKIKEKLNKSIYSNIIFAIILIAISLFELVNEYSIFNYFDVLKYVHFSFFERDYGIGINSIIKIIEYISIWLFIKVQIKTNIYFRKFAIKTILILLLIITLFSVVTFLILNHYNYFGSSLFLGLLSLILFFQNIIAKRNKVIDLAKQNELETVILEKEAKLKLLKKEKREIILEQEREIKSITDDNVANNYSVETENYERECPMCAEKIKLKAKVCRFCGNKFDNE